MTALFFKMINMSITASWLIVAVILARPLIRRAPKWISCLMWGLVMVRLVCPFSIRSNLSVIPEKEVIHHGSIAVGKQTVLDSLPAGSTAVTDPIQTATTVAAYIWLVGICVMLTYALISYIRLKKTVRMSLPVRDNIRICDEVKSPFILGVINPVIYIPSDLPEESLKYVLSHEEAHIRRKDHWWKPLAYLVLTVYWLNPLCWAAYILFSKDIELACDEKVILGMDREQRAGYSQALLNESCQVRVARICPLAFGEVSVKERVKAVLNYRKPAFWAIIGALILCCVMAAVLMTDPAEAGSKIADDNAGSNVSATEEAETAEASETDKAAGTALIVPVENAIVTSVFGFGSGKMHSGVDFAAEEGTPVFAAAGGVVTIAGWDEVYGYCIEIDHENGNSTFYAHNESINVSAGDKVSQGQTIAAVGNTGKSTGPHLHFEVRVNDDAVDPLPWLGITEEHP